MHAGYAQAADQSIERHQAEAEKIIAKSKEIVMIRDAEAEARAVEFLKQVKLRMQDIEAARSNLLGPIKEHVKRIETVFKQVLKPLEQADEAVRSAITSYRSSAAFKEAEAARQQIEQEARDAMAAGNITKLEALASQHEAAAAAAPTKVETQSGEAWFRKTWRWEVSDLEQLPAEYWAPDEKKIAAAVKAGITIAGVKAWQEETPVIV